MKEIKIKLVGFWEGFDPTKNVIFQILNKHFHVQFCDEADYIFCSVFGTPYEYCQYPQVRIMFSGENYIPDFNLIDYAICPYPIEFLDRCIYNPFVVDDPSHFLALQYKNRNFSSSIVNEKEFFANFIAGHESENNIRGDFFKELSKYKRVESAGTYLNNMPDNTTVSFKNNTKTDFQKKCKFTLCFESTKHEGFITEKIIDAYFSDTIPIYYGSNTICNIFNSKSFVNCSQFDSFAEAIEYIKEIDQNDEKYLQMLQQPIFNKSDTPEFYLKKLENYLIYIFNQPLDLAFRRSKVYTPARHDMFLKHNNNTRFKILEEINIFNSKTNTDNHKNYSRDITKKHRKKIRKLLKPASPFPLNRTNIWVYAEAYPYIDKITRIFSYLKNQFRSQ